ncbi:MAG: MFS transporter [Myxococcales bacterium]
MVLCTLALFVVSLGYGVVVPLLPQLADQGSDATLLSIVYAVYAATKIGAQVPGGAWVDRAGGRRVLLFALALFTLSLAGFCAGGSLRLFAVVRAIEGAATGLVYPAVFSLVLQGASENRTGRRIGAVVGVGTSGLLVGPALGGVLAPFGLRVPVLVALLASAALTAVCFVPLRAEPARPSRPRTLRAEAHAILLLAGDLTFLGLALPIAFNKLTFSAFQGLLPLHGPAAFGLGTRGVAGLFVLTGVCFALAQGAGGWLVDRFSARAVAIAVTAPLLASLALMTFARGAPGFAAAYASYVFVSSIVFTATFKQAARTYGTDDTYGGLFGVLGTLTDLMTIVGPLLFLNLYSRIEGQVFLAMAVAGVPFAIGFLRLGPAVPAAA